jgi:microcystin-dependent protein
MSASQPYVGEIFIFAGNFAPAGWALCNGQLMAIAETDVLFTLIGTTYGGDGQSTFALPDLRGRAPIHQGTENGNTYTIGEFEGTEGVTLTVGQLPVHSHGARGNPGGNVVSPAGAYWGADPGGNTAAYTQGAPNASMAAGAITPAGGSQSHANVQPFLCVTYIISLFGIFPSQN